MNFKPKTFTIPLPPRAFYSNGRTTYRLPDSPGSQYAYLGGHLFKVLQDVLVITQHPEGTTISGVVRVQVIGPVSKANMTHHNAHLRTLAKRPVVQPDRGHTKAAPDGMADNWLAQGVFHSAQAQATWTGAKTLVDDFVKFELVGLSIAAAIPVAYAIPYYAARAIGYYYAFGGTAAVLGRYADGYVTVGRAIEANVLAMPQNLFKLLEYFGEGWTANAAFLDEVLASGQRIYLSSNPAGQGGSIYDIELWYLEVRGYLPLIDEYTASLWRMLRR